MTTPSSPITTVQDKYNAVQTAHQTQEDNLRSFIQQAENRLRDLQNKIQDFGQKQQDFTTKLDQTLQTLEQEIGKSSGIIASLSPGNSLSKKELVTQNVLVYCKVSNKWKVIWASWIKKCQTYLMKLVKGFSRPSKMETRCV